MGSEYPVAGHKHLLYDLWLDDVSLLERVERWTEILLGVAERSRATVIGQQFHQFEPYGVTGFVLLAESHVSVHTWLEEGLVTIDVFACGEIDADAIVSWLREQLHPRHDRITLVTRGGSGA
jgi:S-adenosylmethionine decarboxylase